MKDTEHKEYILFDSFYLKLENTNLIYSNRKQINDCLGPVGGEGAVELTRERYKRMGNGNVLCLDYGSGDILSKFIELYLKASTFYANHTPIKLYFKKQK